MLWYPTVLFKFTYPLSFFSHELIYIHYAKSINFFGLILQCHNIHTIDFNDIYNLVETCIYICHICLCWRCTQVVSDRWPDVILSCRTLPMQGDLILFITGAGSARQYLQVAVLALLVLRPLLVPNALVCNELNYWAGRYVCAPCAANLGIRISWRLPCLGGNLARRKKKIRQLIIFFIIVCILWHCNINPKKFILLT